MPRTMWKGAIGFGLVSVPVVLAPATEEHDIRLHQVHDQDGGRVRNQRTCEVCGEVVPYENVAKGFERDGKQAVLSDADLNDLPLPSKRLIDVLAFVDADEIDPLQLDRAYVLSPETSAANKPYILLRETLKQTDRVAVTKIALRSKESLALLRVHGDLLTLHTMFWPDEVRDPAGLAPPSSVKVRPQEIKMAAGLTERMSKDFDLEALGDEYQAALRELIQSKIEDKPMPKRETAAAPSNVVDLMAALQASIDRADAGDASGPAPAPRKAAAKKTVKSAPKKGVAKKASPKRRSG